MRRRSNALAGFNEAIEGAAERLELQQMRVGNGRVGLHGGALEDLGGEEINGGLQRCV